MILNPQQWAEVERLFEACADMAPLEYEAFLARACADEFVRREVDSLLENSATSVPAACEAIAAEARFLSRDADPDEFLIGAHLGPYKVDSIVGHGGMGAVYRAFRDDAEYHQEVAIKLLRPAALTREALRRFKLERQILARLSHPNIARLLDGGSTPDGIPYLVMEFIEGDPITEWCRRNGLSIEQRLRLFVRLAEAVEFAHRNFVVHRDLKPSNVLVTRDGIPKLLDFGVSKIISSVPGEPASTLSGMVALTPEYAAPEQIRGEPASEAVDIYALGLILYQILTGVQAQKLKDRSPTGMARIICETEPVAPATINPELSGDLDSIVCMAIRKEPGRRYRSAQDLAGDLERHLNGLPVAARPDTFTYRTGKFLARNRTTVFATSAVAAILLIAFLAAYRLRMPEGQPRALQVTQLTHTGTVSLYDGLATDGSIVYLVQRGLGSRSLARIPATGGEPQLMPGGPPFPEIFDISPEGANLLVDGGLQVIDDQPLWIVPTRGGAAHQVKGIRGHSAAWSRDGRAIIYAQDAALNMANPDGTGVRKIVDIAGRADSIRAAPAPLADMIRFSMHTPDFKEYSIWEATLNGSSMRRFWPDEKQRTAPPAETGTGTWMLGGKYYVFRSSRNGIARVYVTRERNGRLAPSTPHPVQLYSTPLDLLWLAPTPDGKRIFFVSGQERRHFVRYDRSRHQFVPFLPAVQGRWLTFSKDGRGLAYTTVPGESLSLTQSSGEAAQRVLGAGWFVLEPDWSADGEWIVFSGGKVGGPAGIFAISVKGGDPTPLTPPGMGDYSVSWSPDGKSIVFSSTQGLKIMDWKSRSVTLLPGSQSLSRPKWSPDGHYLAVTRRDGLAVQLYDFKTRAWTLLTEGHGLGPPFWSHDSRYVYYQEFIGAPGMPIFRVRLDGKKIERVADSSNILQSDMSSYSLCALAPNDTPIAAVLRTNSDLYALDLELP